VTAGLLHRGGANSIQTSGMESDFHNAFALYGWRPCQLTLG
jgi:hypothetical protein